MFHKWAHKWRCIVWIYSVLEVLSLSVVFQKGTRIWLMFRSLWCVREPMGSKGRQIVPSVLYRDELYLVHVVFAEGSWWEEFSLDVINIRLWGALRNGGDCWGHVVASDFYRLRVCCVEHLWIRISHVELLRWLCGNALVFLLHG